MPFTGKGKNILQTGCFCLEGAAKFCALALILRAGVGQDGRLGISLAACFLCCVLTVLLQRRLRWENTFFAALLAAGGRKTALVFYFTAFCFFLSHAAVFVNLWAELIQEYMLPEAPVLLLCLVPAGAGAGCTLAHSKRRRLAAAGTALALAAFSVTAAGMALLPGRRELLYLLLLPGLTVTVVNALVCSKKLCCRLYGEGIRWYGRQKQGRISRRKQVQTALWWGTLLLVYAAACGFRGPSSTAGFYLAYDCMVLLAALALCRFCILKRRCRFKVRKHEAAR